MLHALIRFSDLLVVDRKPRYRRPPSKLYADIQQSSSTPLGSSLQSLAQRASINNKTTQKSSSLQSLAQRAAGQRGMSALQTLASRQQQQRTTTTTTTTNTATTTSTTTSSSPKPSSLAALAQKSSANKGRTSLAHLATRSRPSETSTRSSSSNQGLSGLAKLAKSNISDKPTLSSSSLEKQQHQQQQQQPVKETMKDAAPTKAFHITNDQPANPLCAKPSAAANFLFMHMYPEQANTTTPAPIPAFSSVGQVFYEAVKTSDDTIQVFSFDVPSPDDIVMEAQSQRSGGQLRKS